MVTSRQISRAFKQGVKLGRQGISTAKQKHRTHKQNVALRRLQKARTVKSILNSNLPQDVKNREIARLSSPFAQTRVKSTFFKAQRAKQDIGQRLAPIRKTKFLSFIRRERAPKHVSFGTEAEQ